MFLYYYLSITTTTIKLRIIIIKFCTVRQLTIEYVLIIINCVSVVMVFLFTIINQCLSYFS